MPSTHKREKPWDTDDLDKWKARIMFHHPPMILAHMTLQIDTFKPEDNLSGTFTEESSFATLFPKYVPDGRRGMSTDPLQIPRNIFERSMASNNSFSRSSSRMWSRFLSHMPY